jgi:hypothetical protein
MLTQKPAKVLWDAHLDYDILPLDILEGAAVEGSCLKINQETYQCLVVPRAPLLPEKALAALNGLSAKGLPVIYIDGAPAGIKSPEIVPLEKLAEAIAGRGIGDIKVEGDFPLLRICHWIRGKNHYFMLFNEDVEKTAKTIVRFPCSGNCLKVNLLDGLYSAHQGPSVPLELSPYQSVVVVFGDELPEANYREAEYTSAETLDLPWDIELYDMGKGDLDGKFKPYLQKSKLQNITGPGAFPEFSGIIRYKAEFSLENAGGSLALDFGAVGETVKLKLNGQDCGLAICPPYRFDVSGKLKAGNNSIEAEVANTLAQAIKDPFSFFIQIPPSGLTGPVRLLRGK